MNTENQTFVSNLFSYYDKTLQPFPLGYQALISLAIIIFLVWNIFAFLKTGKWVLALVFILALPGTWPALKRFSSIIVEIMLGLAYRLQG